MADLNALIRTALGKKKQQTQPVQENSIPQVSSSPYASVTKVSRTGPTVEVFNPALEQAKEGVKGVVETQQALRSLDTIFDKAENDIPAQADQAQAFKTGIRRGLGKATFMGVTPAQAFGMADEGAMSYDQTKKAFGTQIARGLGERGVVTNQDVERIFNALPKDNDTVNVRQANRALIRKILTDRINNYNKIYRALKARKGQNGVQSVQ